MVQFIHSLATRNLGDIVSCPKQYFRGLNGNEGDYADYNGGPVVFGGGGFYNDIVDFFLNAKVSPRVVWGMGTNIPYGHGAQYPHVFREFEIVGCRDFGSPFEYVPCPTCMSPAFDTARNTQPKHKVVIYEQWCEMIYAGHRSEIPVLSNRCASIGDAVSFLASGELVVTNSYHGAYWAQLLGRKVIGYRLTSNKFRYMKYPIHSKSEFGDWSEPCIAAHDFLEECRRINTDFYMRVKKAIQ